MASAETLNASQRAVLQLLLRQGKSYAEIAGLLNTEADAVRARAHGAVAALAPAPAELPADRAAELTDHLLGQQTDAELAAARSLLEGSAPARAWARGAADALRPLASRPLPAIPPDPGAEPTAEAPAAEPQPDAAPASLPTPAPDGDAAPQPAAHGATGLSPTALRVLLGGLAAVAVIAIAIVVVLVTSGEDGATPAAVTTTTTTPTTTAPTAGQPAAVIIAQAEMRAPKGGIAGARGQAGIVLFRESRRYRFAVQASGLPATSQRSAAYGVWLYTDARHSQFLGLADTVVGGDGRLDAVRDLSPDTPTFNEVLLTREVSQSPENPGPVVLRGPLVTAAAASSGGTQPTTTTP